MLGRVEVEGAGDDAEEGIGVQTEGGNSQEQVTESCIGTVTQSCVN